MKKRIFAILCCVAMLLTCFAACGSASTEADAQEETTEATEESAEAETSAETAEATSEETSEEVSEEASAEDAEETEEAEESGEAAENEQPFTATLPGADTAELSFSNVYSLPLTTEDEEITIVHTALSLMGDLANLGINSFQEMDYIQEIQERTGVTLNIRELTYDTYDQQVSLLITSGDLPDLFYGLNYSSGDEGALEDGIIVNLSEYADYAPNYFYMVNSNEDQVKAFQSDGKVLKFMSPYDQYRANQGMVIRSDWLEELGLDVPETYDQLTEVLEAFKTSCGAETAIYMNKQCYVTGLSDGYDITAFIADGGTDTSIPYYVDNGTVYSTLNADGFRDYLSMLNEWYEKGLIDADFASIDYDPFSSYLSGQIESDQMGVWVTSGEGIDNYTKPITCLSMPVQNEGDSDHIFTTSLTSDSQNDIYVTTACENLELVLSYVDYWFSEDGIMFYNYGIEGETYTLNENGEPEFTDMVVNNEYDLSVSNMMRLYCGYGVWNAPMLRMRTASYNSDLVNEAWEVWSSNLDGAMSMPDYISLNTEQSETVGYYSSDLLTYAMEMVPQFIIGSASLEDDWDTYCERLEEMGLSECVSVWQEAYDNVMK